MKKISYLLGIIFLCIVCLISCEKNRNDEARYGKYVEIIPNELEFLQNSLTKLDNKGNLLEHYVGVVLDPADETELSVGVDNIEEAKHIFASWFADTTIISADGMEARFTCREGSAKMTAQTNNKGQIAYVTFDVTGLKYVTRIYFILNDAWPENAGNKGFHKLGVKYEYNCWTGKPAPAATDWFDRYELIPYVCIREYNNGNPALLVAIRKDPIFLYWRYSDEYSGNIPGESMAQEISSILRSNWSTYKSYFNTDGDILNDGEDYWYNDGSDFLVGCHRYTIYLSSGEDDYYDVHYKEPRKRVLFYLLSGQKM